MVPCLHPTRQGHLRLLVGEEVVLPSLQLRCSLPPIQATVCGSRPTRVSVLRTRKYQEGASSAAPAGLLGWFILGVAVETNLEVGQGGSCAVSVARLKKGSEPLPVPRVPIPNSLLPINIYHYA